MRKITLIYAMLFAFLGIYAQSNLQKSELKFTKPEIFNDYKIVHFVLDKDIDYRTYKEIMLNMKEKLNIMDFWLDGTKLCKIKLDNDITPENVLVYLKKYGYDFAFEYVQKVDVKIDLNQDVKLPAHYPERKKVDGKKVSDDSFKKALDFWKNRYPNEYKDYTNNKDNNTK